jgi:hypothetical protein
VLLPSDGLTAEDDCGGRRQEPADGPSLVPSLGGEGDGRLVEGCDPPIARRAVGAREDQQVIHMTLRTKPPKVTHWSLRSMAAAAGVSCSSVQRRGGARAQAASGETLESLARQALRRQSGGPGRALSRSTRQGAGLLRRRKEPNPRPRLLLAGIAHEEGNRPAK